MARIVVIGGGLIGLATALMVAKQGHDVTVLERDPAPPPNTPDEAWDHWIRHGVMQFRQPHYLLPAGLRVLGEHLPEVVSALEGAGAVQHTMLSPLPPGITDRAPRPDDGKFLTRTACRPVLEHAMASAAGTLVEIRRGARVVGLLTTRSRQVTGVRLQDRAELHADLVIDAMGRASPLPVWLDAAGLYEVAERAEETGFAYYSRFFRARPGEEPPALTGTITSFDCYSIVTIPADAGTWSVTVSIHARDRALKKLREEQYWTRMVGECPLHAHLIERGEPVSSVLAASGVVNRIRALVRAGVPVATGVLSVGDAWACTDPSLGRGVTLGLMHAAIVAEAVADHVKDPFTLALEHDRLTRQRLLPWYRNTVYLDNQRIAQIAAVIEGRSPRQDVPDLAGAPLRDLLAAMTWDADVFRAYLEMIAMLAPPQEIMTRPGLARKITEAAALASTGGRDPWIAPGPSRTEVLKMLS
jgi:2-polyprenyl-6-methoxyphenol hydroxylase-like FAD-dependent oxidoreductase